ncbi:MAG: tRNA 4-thiouridine(8) synthase ThiI [bacterium]
MTDSTSQQSPEPLGAVVLLSGGLDSQLAVCLLKAQGIRVHGITFTSPFFTADKARRAAAAVGVPLMVEDFASDVLSLLHKPPHGFGSNMNPCIDCHALMLRRAGGLMESLGCRFICTGEVLNQRPMSQNLRSLKIVEQCSGYAGFIVRPLSAKLLPETEPERLGWIRRDQLLDINGRRRDIQLRLAGKYGLTEFPSPAGGCLLTDPGFSARLRDLRGHDGLDDPAAIELLKLGRHLRLGQGTKLIVGRNMAENGKIEAFAGTKYLVLRTEVVPGPTCLLTLTTDDALVRQAAVICASYSDVAAGTPARVRVTSAGGDRFLDIQPVPRAEIDGLRI